MKKLYFIRHGLSQMNLDGKVSGHTDTPLTDEGRKQAMEAAKSAKDLGVDLILSSPLVRAHETAEIIAKEIGYPIDKIHTNKLLIERNHGSMEGQPWHPNLDIDEVDDAENNEELIARAKQALEWINGFDAKTILIVSHGGLGRALRSHVLPEYNMEHPSRLGNAEIIRWL